MGETRELAAILTDDIVGYSRLAATDEDRSLTWLRALRSDLIDPTIAVHHGLVVKRTGDGAIVEFRNVVDAVRCAIEVQNAMVERNAARPRIAASSSEFWHSPRRGHNDSDAQLKAISREGVSVGLGRSPDSGPRASHTSNATPQPLAALPPPKRRSYARM